MQSCRMLPPGRRAGLHEMRETASGGRDGVLSGLHAAGASFEKGRAAFVYDQLMRASISRFKYHNRREYADFYAEELLRRFGRTLRSWQPDALIPVPIHKSRMRKRGFNQAALVADRIGERLGIPVGKRGASAGKKDEAPEKSK
ncbi:MAG: hypothetical protein V8Q27_02355 [Eubacteriales bacterium]